MKNTCVVPLAARLRASNSAPVICSAALMVRSLRRFTGDFRSAAARGKQPAPRVDPHAPELPRDVPPLSVDTGSRLPDPARKRHREERMGFGEAISTCFSNYATFTGRATRLNIGIGSCSASLPPSSSRSSGGDFRTGGQTLGWLFNLATIVPTIAVATRRLHDTDRSGWWQLLGFIPMIGWIILLVWFCQPGTRLTGSCNRCRPAIRTVPAHIRATATDQPCTNAQPAMLQFLAWVADRQRNHADVMDAWQSSCPRLSVWEDAVIDGYAQFVGDAARSIVLTPRGRAALDGLARESARLAAD